MKAFYTYPSYFDEIVEKLVRRDWLVHNFNDVNSSDIYNFANYVHSKQLNDVTYTIFLDLNIYQYIINAYKKDKPKDEFRDAMALVAFCQLSQIELDPTYAVYEKLNYRTDTESLDEVISDLEIFNKINNINNDSIITYIFGVSDTVIPNNRYPINKAELGRNLTKYKRLTEWDSLYLIVLFIIYTSLSKHLSRLDKLKNVVEWMIQEFRLSLVCVTFASIFFGDKPLKKMMKYKSSLNAEAKRRNAFNMTWDLYNLNRYFREWTERDNKNESMFASGDKAFNEILRNSITVQQTGNLSCFEQFLPSGIINYLNQITSQPDMHFERAYMSDIWSPDYREQLIKKYEVLIGIS